MTINQLIVSKYAKEDLREIIISKITRLYGEDNS